jgi:ubiquinone/menaquinone biosynthesis C-methylase UbiE
MQKPRILDVGCGSGIPTIELAKLSQGEVIGVDIDDLALSVLRQRIKSEGLSDRVKTLRESIDKLDLPQESFDIVWAEGSISFIGFEKGLRSWHRLIKPGGYLVIHDVDLGDTKKKRKMISSCGYVLMRYFRLSKELWGKRYFHPMEMALDELKAKKIGSPDLAPAIREAEEELRYFRVNPEKCASIYFILRKRPLLND